MPYHQRHNHHLRGRGRNISLHNGNRIERRHGNRTRYDGIDRHLIHAIDNYLIPEELNKHNTRSRRKYFEDSQDGTNDESDADDIMLEPFDENFRKRGKNILDLEELGKQAYEINGSARKIHHKENQRQYYADCDAAICDRRDTSGRYERLTRKKIGDTVNFSRNGNPTTTRPNQCNLRNGYHEMINRDEDEMDTEHYPVYFDSQTATRAYSKAYESDSHNSRYNAQVEDQSDTTDHTGYRYTKRYLTREPTDANDNVQRSHYTVSTPEPSDRRPSRNRNYSWKYPGNEYVAEKSYNKPIPLSMISPIQHIKSDARHASTYDVNYLDRRNDREPSQNSQAEIEQKVTYQKMPLNTRSKHHEMRYDFEHRSNVYHSRNMDNGPKLVTRARNRYLTPGSNLVSHTTISNDIHRELSNKKTTRKLSSQVKIDPDVSDGHIVTIRTRNLELVSNTSDGKFRMPLSKEKIHSKDSNGIKNLRQLKKCVNIEMHEEQHKDEIRAIRKQAHRKTNKKASVPKALRRIIIQKVKILLACVENDNIFSTEAFNAEFENLTAQVLKLKLLQKDEKRSKSTSTLDRDEFFSGSLTKTGERKEAKTKGTSNESKYRNKQFDEMDEQGSCDNKIEGSHLKLMSDEDNNVIWNITRTDEVQVKDINNNAAIADKLNSDEQKAIVSHAGKKGGVSRKAAFDVKYDEIIQLFNHTKVLLMSPELDGKMTGVHQFHAIVKAVHDESRLIQLILNENILSFLSIEAILSSENCTKEFCQSMNIISGHSCFYSNNVAKEVLENMVRVLDVCLDDRSQNGKVPLLFGTLAQVILNSVEPLSSTLERTKIFMLIQKVHNLIGLTRLDLHIQSIQIITRIVKEFKTVDDKLTRMLSNIKEITNGILIKEINGNVAKSMNANFRTYMIENSKLLEECLDLYAICGVEAENVKQCDDEIKKRNESLLFLSDVDNNGTNEKLQMESEDCEMYISADHSIDMKQLLETISDNFKKNMMHDELIINPNDFEYWASALRIVCVLMKYNDLRELKIYKTLYSLYSIQQNAISKGIRDEIYKDYLLVVAKFWKTIADKVFQCNAVNKLLDENIGTLMTIPHKLWVRTLTNDFYELKLKFTILVLVYIFNCFRIEIDIFRYGDSVFQNIINEADLPKYVVKVMLFLACMKKKVSLIKSLTLPIERCSVFAEVDTEYDYCDCLLKNWNHYESYRFKWFVVEKYLSLNMGHTRKKRFERFVLSNEKLMVFLSNIMLLIPLNKNTLDQIGSILGSKIKRDKANNNIVDDLWNSLNHILKNHHTAFHNNLQYFLELCLIRTPSMLKFNFPIDDSNIANKEKMNQLVILSDLLTKYLIKIEIQKDNLALLGLLQMMLFVILNRTKNMNNRRIIECNTKSKIPDIATKTAVLLSDNKDVRASSFNHLYLTFTNRLVDLCQKHEIPLHINFNYTYLVKQIINRDIILMEQLLKLLRTLFLNLVKVNPLLRHTIQNFQNIFIGTDFLFELVYTFLLNSLSLHKSHSDLILAILIIMLQLKGHVVYNNPFNYTIVKTISREKSYSQFFLRFVNALFNLFLENFAESSRCLGKPRRVKIVEIIGCNMNYLSQQFDGSPVLNQLEEKLSRLSITCEDTNSDG